MQVVPLAVAFASRLAFAAPAAVPALEAAGGFGAMARCEQRSHATRERRVCRARWAARAWGARLPGLADFPRGRGDGPAFGRGRSAVVDAVRLSAGGAPSAVWLADARNARPVPKSRPQSQAAAPCPVPRTSVATFSVNHSNLHTTAGEATQTWQPQRVQHERLPSPDRQTRGRHQSRRPCPRLSRCPAGAPNRQARTVAGVPRA
jgi:hypothetical protein